ncbi:hypothetical protein [uncultured Microbulbifer sp.]|uniref:hypothetical protein n=1 Tax=uncultured Microbulbifer sp. TaxID=348147 RepID=UPI00262AEAC8|nr:hypothetical protein [uncultured Microbulbifer sp.]
MRERKAVSSLVSPKVRFFNFNTELFVQAFPGNPESVGAIDASFICKSRRKTEGLGWYCNGCAGTSQRGIEVSMISITNLKSNTAYALDAQQTIDEEDRSRVDICRTYSQGRLNTSWSWH